MTLFLILSRKWKQIEECFLFSTCISVQPQPSLLSYYDDFIQTSLLLSKHTFLYPFEDFAPIVTPPSPTSSIFWIIPNSFQTCPKGLSSTNEDTFPWPHNSFQKLNNFFAIFSIFQSSPPYYATKTAFVKFPNVLYLLQSNSCVLDCIVLEFTRVVWDTRSSHFFLKSFLILAFWSPYIPGFPLLSLANPIFWSLPNL